MAIVAYMVLTGCVLLLVNGLRIKIMEGFVLSVGIIELLLIGSEVLFHSFIYGVYSQWAPAVRHMLLDDRFPNVMDRDVVNAGYYYSSIFKCKSKEQKKRSGICSLRSVDLLLYVFPLLLRY